MPAAKCFNCRAAKPADPTLIDDHYSEVGSGARVAWGSPSTLPRSVTSPGLTRSRRPRAARSWMPSARRGSLVMVWGSRVTAGGAVGLLEPRRPFAMATAAPTGASHRSSPAAGCGSRRCAASPRSANDPGPVGPSQEPRTRHRLRSQDRRSRDRRGRLRLLAPTRSSRSDPTFVAGSSACHYDNKFVTLGPMGPPLEEAATSLDSRPDPPAGRSDE